MLKKCFICFLAGFVTGLVAGFFIAKGIYDRPLDESVSRDTVIVHDTIPDYNPAPKDSSRIKWMTKWLPVAVHDTVDRPIEVTNWMRDTVAVSVPITSKHYSGETYDAWVSGFEPSLDSIKVYRETQVITETITRMKPPNKLSLDVRAGADYLTATKTLSPYVSGNLEYNISQSRFSIGARGGVYRMHDKTEPFADGYLKFRIF